MHKSVTSPPAPAKTLRDNGWGALMAAAQMGDQAAYLQLLAEVQGWLRGYFLGRTKESGVEDLVQETLIALHTRRHTFDPQYPFTPWMATIAHHKWVDMVRKQVRAAEVALEDDDGFLAAAGPDVTVLKDLETLLSKLPPAQRQAIDLVKLQGFSIEEAATRSGQSAALVKVNIHRGLKKLMTFVEQEKQ